MASKATLEAGVRQLNLTIFPASLYIRCILRGDARCVSMKSRHSRGTFSLFNGVAARGAKLVRSSQSFPIVAGTKLRQKTSQAKVAATKRVVCWGAGLCTLNG